MPKSSMKAGIEQLGGLCFILIWKRSIVFIKLNLRYFFKIFLLRKNKKTQSVLSYCLIKKYFFTAHLMLSTPNWLKNMISCCFHYIQISMFFIEKVCLRPILWFKVWTSFALNETFKRCMWFFILFLNILRLLFKW